MERTAVGRLSANRTSLVGGLSSQSLCRLVPLISLVSDFADAAVVAVLHNVREVVTTAFAFMIVARRAGGITIPMQ